MVKRIVWTAHARADLRRIEQRTALNILHELGNFAQTQEGDVKHLVGEQPPQWRLRIGDYRVRFYNRPDEIEILAVKHRREAYR